MDLSFFPLTLEAVDKAQAESLCLFIAADERPLTGLAGLADWRLSGKLSRLLRSGLLTGDAGEAVLTPPGARIGFKKLFVFGLGPMAQPEEKLVAQLGEALRKLDQAGAHEVAMELPARLSPDISIRLVVEALQGPGRALVFGQDPQKLITGLSRVASHGAGAQLERRVVKVETPQKPVPPVRQYVRTPTPTAVPKVSPPPFAPDHDLPATDISAPPPAPIPKASPLPFAPEHSEPPIAQPASEPPSAPPAPEDDAADAESPSSEPQSPSPEPQSSSSEPPKPGLPPSQRYVPPPPKEDHVFKKKKRH